MSTRADAIALRSVLFLSALLASVLTLRYGEFNFGSSWPAPLESSPPDKVADESPQTSVAAPQTWESPQTLSREAVPPVEIRQGIAVATPIPIVKPITRLKVAPSKWSAPLHVPPGQSVGIKFSLGRIRVERDGVAAGTLFRNPTVMPNRNGITLRPLASLDRTPRVFWFEKGIRVLRFISLEEKQAEEVEVLWKS